MKCRLGLIGITVVALNAGVVGGGVTSSRADEAGIESRVWLAPGSARKEMITPGQFRQLSF